MHKKYNKYTNKDLLLRNSSYKRTHVKYKKESDSVNELIKVPQNSKCDISRKYYGDIENTENLKLRHKHREKYYKHKRSERNHSAEHHNKKHERQSSHNIPKAASLLFENEPLAKHKENYSKKEKRDKERLNKIEKYLEGFNDISQKVRGRNRSSVSLKSSENFLENRQRYIRREKTFHGEITRRRDSSESYPVLFEARRLKDQKLKAKEDKKQKHRENKERDSNKDKDDKYSHRQLLYCQIDNPLEASDRKHGVEKHPSEFHKNYREKSLNKTKRHSSSKDRSASPRGEEIKIIKLEKSSRNRDHSRQSKEKRSTEQIKYSPRKAKRKDHHRSTKEPKSKVNLGPYDKYFILDKKSDIEDENKYQRKWHHRTNKENSRKVPKSDIVNEKISKEEKKRKKHFLEEETNKSKGNAPISTQEEFREKIEDDIKGYFTRIQTLIDKKLDFILHGSSKESKINDTGKENCADIAQHKKKRRSESKEGKHAPHQSKSTKNHKSRKHDKVRHRDCKEHAKRNHKSHTSMTREEMKLIDEEYKRQKRYKSLNRHDFSNIPSTNNLGNNERELRHHRRHNALQPDFDDRLLPNHLVNMVENVSAYSMRSKKSYSGEKVAVKEVNSEAKLRPKHAHKVPNNDNNQHRTHRESSSGRRNFVADEMMCAGVANDFCSEEVEPPKLLESYSKKSRRRLYRPLNLECKTVSIIGIPSQIKESIIFNETQTTTSLNIVNPVEDPVERKKKTKRFKLYYKYSLANNNICRSDSGNSSDGKSIISDSYRIVSGNSEHNSEVCLNNTEQEPTKESRKVVFVMKRESLANVSGDTFDNQIAIEQFSRKCRKPRAVSPVASKLNNIVEEPSNTSCLDEINKTLQSINSDINCKYFNILESSSSACNLHLLKKTAFSDWNIPVGKCKCRIFDNHSDKMPVHKNHGKKFTHEKDISLENKIRRVEINQMHDKKIKYRRIREFGQKYNSKSDIDISYDSLQMSNYKVKTIKNKSKSNLSSHLIENSKYIPSEEYTKRSSNRPDNQHVVDEDPVELKLKENVCQTEHDIDKDAIEELINTNAYKKYVADLIESHQIAHRQDVAKSNVPDIDAEAKKSRKKDAYREVTRIPSIIHKNRVEKPLPHCSEIGTESKEIAEEIYISPKYSVRNHSREKIMPGSKAHQKKLVDVGVEVAIIGEKLRKEPCTDRNKSHPKTSDAAVEVKAINTPKRYLINCGRKNTEVIEKYTAPAETKKPSIPKHISLINREPLKKKRSISEQSKRSISQQSKQQHNYTTDTTPVKSLNNSRLPTYIVSGRSNIHKVERPASAREKSPHKRDLPQAISDHDIKRSLSAVDKITKPSQSDIKKKNRLGVKGAKVKDVPRKKCVASNTSRLTLTESNKTKTHTRSNSCSYKSRLSNKSNISLCDMNASDQSKITSLVCLDKFMYGTKINLSSTSHAQSLDQYTTKSLIGDPCHSSRLFLTKDYIPQVNTYQRRKLYGEGIRKKMRKNCQIQDVLVPQVFEVRYLTFEKDAVNEGSEVTSNATFDSNQLYCINKLNSVVTEKYKKANSQPHSLRKFRKSKIPNRENESRSPFASSINDVNRLNKFRKKTEVKIEEIFMKGNKLREEREPHIFDLCKHLADIQSSSLIMKDSFDEFKSLGRSSNLKFGENAGPDPNFMHLVDYLCESIVGYCSDINIPQEELKPPQEREAGNNTKESIDTNILNDTSIQQHEAKSIVIDKVSVDHETPADDKQTKNTSDEKVPAAKQHSLPHENTKYPEKLTNVSPKPLVCGHMSCPTLGGTASSFEFLYEEDSMELSKDTILASLTKPRDTILGYALHCNDTVIIRKEAYTSMGKRIDQISNSPTDSGESGYSSNSSKKYSSATSFFKKPHIAALFKPPPPLAVEEQDKDLKKSLIEPQDSPHYKVMSRKCQEYAQKVRTHSENRDLEENFQEIPLDVLLGMKNSTVLDHCNSDCSICNEYSEEKEAIRNIFDFGENYDKPESLVKRVSKTTLIARALLEEESLESFEQKENKMETLIYYGNPRCKPSLEIIQNQKPPTKLIDADARADEDADTLEQEIIEYPMVLSNTNLHKGSLTLIDVKQDIDYAKDEDPNRDGKREELQSENCRTNCDRLEANRNISDSNLYHVEGPSANTIKSAIVNDESVNDKQLKETVIHAGIASDLISSYTTSTSETKKLMAKKFFENLLRVYEKEIAVTTRLFQDDNFFINDLLTSVSDAEEKKKRKGKLKTIIKGKIRGYIGNVFAPKSNAENQSVCSLETDQGVATHFENINQRKLKMLANDARKYFSMFVQAVTANKDINDEIKICGLLKLLQRIEKGDFTILRTEEEVNFENEIKDQVKEAFINIYEISVKEAKKHKRSLTIDDLKLIKAFVSKYRIGLLSKTDIIATYIGRGVFKTETHLSAAVTYLIRIQSKDVNLKEFEEYCKVCTCTKSKKKK